VASTIVRCRGFIISADVRCATDVPFSSYSIIFALNLPCAPCDDILCALTKALVLGILPGKTSSSRQVLRGGLPELWPRLKYRAQTTATITG
jgi:hypothetical protein